jgi:outer membrane protein TolC
MKKLAALQTMLTLTLGACAWPQQATATRQVVTGPLGIEQAVQTALRESPLLKGQSAEVGAARARLQQTLAGTRLTGSTTSHLTTGDGINMVQGPAGAMPMDMEMVGPSLTLNQNVSVLFPLYTGGRLKSQVQAARSALGATQQDVETVRQSLALDTRLAYRRVLLAQSVVGIYGALVKDEEERLRVDQAQFEAGKIPRVNLLRDEADLADARQKLTDARRDVALALVDLKTVMGVDLKSDFTLSDQLQPGAAPPEASPLHERALTQRPELKAVAEQLAAAQARLDVAQSTFKPQVNALAAADWRAQRGLSNDAGVTVGVVAALPLWDGGSRRAEVAEAQAMLEKTRQDEQQLRLAVAQQVESALLRLAAATQNVKTAEAAVASADEDYRLAQLRYTAGKGINLEPLDALVTLTRAQTNRVQALFEQNVALDLLTRAVGTPVEVGK